MHTHPGRFGGLPQAVLVAALFAGTGGVASAQFGLDTPGFDDLAVAADPARAGAVPVGADEALGADLAAIRAEFRALYQGTPVLRQQKDVVFYRLQLTFQRHAGWVRTSYPGHDEAIRRAAGLSDAIFTAAEAAAVAAEGGTPHARQARVRQSILAELRQWALTTEIVRPDRTIFGLTERLVRTPVSLPGDSIPPEYPPDIVAQTMALGVAERFLDEAEAARNQMVSFALPAGDMTWRHRWQRMEFSPDREPEVVEFHGLVADFQWSLLAARGAWLVAVAGQPAGALPPEFDSVDRRGQRETNWGERTYFRWPERFVPPRNRRETLVLPSRNRWPPRPPAPPEPASVAVAEPAEETAEEVVEAPPETRNRPDDPPKTGEPLSPAELTRLIEMARASGTYTAQDETLVQLAERLAPRLDADGVRRVAAAAHRAGAKDAIVRVFLGSQGHRVTPIDAIAVARKAGSYTGHDQALVLYTRGRAADLTAEDGERLAKAAHRAGARDQIVAVVRDALLPPQ